MSVNSQGGDLAVSIGGTYFFTDPSKSFEQFDRKLQRAEQATGNRNNTVDIYDGDSEVKVTVNKNLCDTDGAALFAALGLGAIIGSPTAQPIIFADPNRTVTVPNCTANVIQIDGEKGKPWMIDMAFLATSPPAITAGYGGTRPTFGAVGNYLYWRDLLTFFTAAASGTNCQKFSFKVEHNLDPFYGVRADGYTIPTVYTPTEAYVTGSFTMQMLTSTDYALFVAACQVAADLGLTGKAFCGVTPPTLTLTCKAAIYDSVKPNRAIKKTSLEEFTYMSKALAGANQGVCTLA